MRKINVELNLAKLATKQVQLAQVKARLDEQLLRYETTKAQFEAKSLEVTKLETAINLIQSTPSVS